MNFISFFSFSSKKSQAKTLKIVIPALVIIAFIFIILLYPRKTVYETPLDNCAEKGGTSCIAEGQECPSDGMVYEKKDRTDCISEGMRYCCVPVSLKVP